MNFSASVFDFFKNPKWGMNLLLGGVCVLIPIAGPMALMGWHIGALYGRPNWKEFTTYPEFDFGKFGQYLERGVWPFLVQIVVSLAVVPIMMLVVMVPTMAMMAVMVPQADSHPTHPPEVPPALLAIIPLLVLGYVAIFGLMMLVSKPLMIRAAMTQDFGKAFNWSFFKSFTAKTWVLQVCSAVFLMAAGLVLAVVGVMACFIGMYFTISIAFFAHWHLDRQIYELYLQRGGEPVPLSPKLGTVPPPLLT